MEPTEPPVEFPVEPLDEAEDSQPAGSKVVIRQFPDVIFLYPTWLASIVCALASQWTEVSIDDPGSMGLIFTMVFFVNLSVLAFEYTRTASLLLIVGVSGLGFLVHGQPEVIGFVRDLAEQPIYMTPSFYWGWVVCFALVMLIAIIRSRMNYWTMEDGELLHRKKPYRVVERWPLDGMEATREINDVLEYVLFRSGRMILRPSGTDRIIVIENVPDIVEIDLQVRKMLGTEHPD